MLKRKQRHAKIPRARSNLKYANILARNRLLRPTVGKESFPPQLACARIDRDHRKKTFVLMWSRCAIPVVPEYGATYPQAALERPK